MDTRLNLSNNNIFDATVVPYVSFELTWYLFKAQSGKRWDYRMQ
jgi:hypothetical protein